MFVIVNKNLILQRDRNSITLNKFWHFLINILIGFETTLTIELNYKLYQWCSNYERHCGSDGDHIHVWMCWHIHWNLSVETCLIYPSYVSACQLSCSRTIEKSLHILKLFTLEIQAQHIHQHCEYVWKCCISCSFCCGMMKCTAKHSPTQRNEHLRRWHDDKIVLDESSVQINLLYTWMAENTRHSLTIFLCEQKAWKHCVDFLSILIPMREWAIAHRGISLNHYLRFVKACFVKK